MEALLAAWLLEDNNIFTIAGTAYALQVATRLAGICGFSIFITTLTVRLLQ
jgi:hypothetical protein